MKVFWVLGVFAFVVLAAAAVWMGGLNQDEGWYLYAANLVSEGRMPYRDFFYTQGPLLPIVYSAFTPIWSLGGLLGARIFTLVVGAAGIAVAMRLSHRLAPEGRKRHAAVVTLLLLGCNLYHVYYLAVPKTYALASLLVMIGFWLLCRGDDEFYAKRHVAIAGAGFCLALAAGVRISLGALLATTALCLAFARRWRTFVVFLAAGAAGIALVYGPFVVDSRSLAGLVAAQRYHAARGGADMVWTVGSLSRLVRWYLPVFVMFGLWAFVRPAMFGYRKDNPLPPVAHMLLFGFLAVFVVQMLAPYPYEDYQVPIMGLLAVVASVGAVTVFMEHGLGRIVLLLALGMSFACSFGSPLLEKWSIDGQDRFWAVKKSASELSKLRSVAAKIERLDPGGKTLLTQDLYLAIETGRKVPDGLEMGPFSILSDVEWRSLLSSAPCPIAALSGYTFAVNPPVCDERPFERQKEYWGLLKKDYELVSRVEAFGQNSTTLLILRRK